MISVLAHSQNKCDEANRKALFDYKNSNYSFHSEELFPPENFTYGIVLKKYYKINWYFTDSLEYYSCYDSTMKSLLKTKYGKDFLEKAQKLSDSLENTPNWRKDAQYPGGSSELFKFIYSRLIGVSLKQDTLNTKMYVQIEIDSTGKVMNPKVIKGISKEIDEKVISILKEMPNWEPAYLHGKPSRQLYGIPIRIEYK